MRIGVALFVTLIGLGAGPSTQPTSRATNPVAVAQADVDAANLATVQKSRQLQAARAAAGTAFDDSPQGKALIADLDKKEAAQTESSTDDATKAYRLARSEYDKARNASISKDPQYAAAESAAHAADDVWQRAKAKLAAALAQQDATDPKSKLKREIEKAIRNGEFVDGITESQAEDLAKHMDDPAAPMRRWVETRSDGTRVVHYRGFWPNDPKPSRIVDLTFKDGICIDAVDVKRLRPQSRE